MIAQRALAKQLMLFVGCSLLLAATPSLTTARGVILGYEFQNYFAMDPETGQRTDLGFGPPGRGDFLPQEGDFAVTSDGSVYGLQSNFEFLYKPLQRQGISLGYRDSFLSDFTQGPSGEVYLLDHFGNLDILDVDTRASLGSYTGLIVAEEVAATIGGEIVLKGGASLYTLNRSTGQASLVDTVLPGVRWPTPNAIGADGQGNVLFTSLFPDDNIYRLDPATGVIDTIAVGFDPRKVEFISPGPDGSVIVGGHFEGVRRVDLQTGDTLWSVAWGSEFRPEFALYTTAIPEPASFLMIGLAALANAARRQRWEFV